MLDLPFQICVRSVFIGCWHTLGKQRTTYFKNKNCRAPCLHNGLPLSHYASGACEEKMLRLEPRHVKTCLTARSGTPTQAFEEGARIVGCCVLPCTTFARHQTIRLPTIQPP